MCTILTREPWNLSIEAIADLTDYQIAAVLLAPDPLRSSSGREDGGLSYREWYFAAWRRRGLSEAEIQARWERDYPGEP